MSGPIRITNPDRMLRLYGYDAKEYDMAGKTTRGPIDSHDEGPVKAGQKVGPDKPNLDKEQLDRAPVLDQRDYIVDGNTVVQPTEAEEGKPFDQEQYEKDRAEGLGASGSTVPLDDVAIGLVEGGQGNPAAGRHQSGLMDVPEAEGDPDSIAAWNARHAAEAAAKGETADDTKERARAREDDAQRAPGQADADAKKNR